MLTVCVATDRRVGVISSLSESAVSPTLRAHDLDREIAAVAARPGLDLSFLGTAPAIQQAADPASTCLVVSGQYLATADRPPGRAVGLGCDGGRDPRKHLAAYAPVIPRLATVSQALLNSKTRA